MQKSRFGWIGMPSVHQRAGSTDTYDSDAQRMMATKDRPTLEALARGLDAEGCHEHIQAAVALDDPPKAAIGIMNRRLANLQND